MARKQQRRVPQVPRSNVGVDSTTVKKADGSRVVSQGARVSAPVQSDMATEYAHVRRDLTRIALFGTLIFGLMGILKVATGL